MDAATQARNAINNGIAALIARRNDPNTGPAELATIQDAIKDLQLQRMALNAAELSAAARAVAAATAAFERCIAAAKIGPLGGFRSSVEAVIGQLHGAAAELPKIERPTVPPASTSGTPTAPVPQPAQPSPPPAGATGRADIASAIRDAAAKVGVDAETLGAIAFIESSFRADIRNETTNAFGLFQFIDTTWRDVVRQYGAPLGVSAGDLRELRSQCLMGAALLRESTQILGRGLGRQPTPVDCYVAHFLGVGDGARFLQARPDMGADAALGASAERVIGANKPIFIDGGRIRTVGEVMDLFAGKMQAGLDQARGLFASAPVRTTATPSESSAATAPEMAEPSWLVIARNEIGQKEAAGDADNPRIREYFATTTFGEHPDSVPWCGAFVSFCLNRAGVIDKGSARAADWLKIGAPLAKPRPGCIAVLRLGADESSDHVGFWMKEQGGQMFLLGGNQSDCVNIAQFPAAALQEGGFRWPPRTP